MSGIHLSHFDYQVWIHLILQSLHSLVTGPGTWSRWNNTYSVSAHGATAYYFIAQFVTMVTRHFRHLIEPCVFHSSWVSHRHFLGIQSSDMYIVKSYPSGIGIALTCLRSAWQSNMKKPLLSARIFRFLSLRTWPIDTYMVSWECQAP